jgi:hypothetical protein
MTYAIDTILRLCEENTRLRVRCGEPTPSVENVVLGDIEDEDAAWATLQRIPTKHIKHYLAEECCFHIYDKPPATLEEVEKLKESADLIAESQQKQIDLLLEDKRERMEDRERLVKDTKFYQQQLHELSGILLETKAQLKATEEKLATAVGGNVGRPKKLVCSPCIADPTP